MPWINRPIVPWEVKKNAYKIYQKALKENKLIRPNKCSECGAGGKIAGHHEDYMKPLDVMWLCAKCHSPKHKKDKNNKIRIPDDEYNDYRKNPDVWEVKHGYVKPLTVDELSLSLNISFYDIAVYVDQGFPVFSKHPLRFIKNRCLIWLSEKQVMDIFKKKG